MQYILSFLTWVSSSFPVIRASTWLSNRVVIQLAYARVLSLVVYWLIDR